jgi:hypothetical protein
MMKGEEAKNCQTLRPPILFGLSAAGSVRRNPATIRHRFG